MNRVTIPKDYRPLLNSYDTQGAIEFIKNAFQLEFASRLGLKRVSAPLFVPRDSGLNDDLSGSERPVSFNIPAVSAEAQVVHSLAKWKRLALKQYNFDILEGLYTDMNAIRRDEELDNIHSIYVDQWDWEKIITSGNRNTEFLKNTVKTIVKIICSVNDKLRIQYPQLHTELSKDVVFVTTQELEDMYPDLTPEEREDAFVKIHKTVFIMKIGDKLKSGTTHGHRAPDYDDWSLNGDIILWNDLLERAFEISSMGIRVDPKSLDYQLSASGHDERRVLPYHRMLLNNELPLTIGGGIGQSRLCMLLMGCAHIGEVQCSIWDKETIRICKEAGIPLL